MRLKHVEAIINKNTVQKIAIKCYICNIIAQKMHNIKHHTLLQIYDCDLQLSKIYKV
jgi:hypothetical protein